MLTGTYHVSMDAKNRIFIPSRWRLSFGDVVYVMQGLFLDSEKCLYAMSSTEWDLFTSKFSGLPITSQHSEVFKRNIFSTAIECDVDKQGRILLSQTLLNLAGIKDDVTVVGLGSHFEIWDKETYETRKKNSDYSESLSFIQTLGV